MSQHIQSQAVHQEWVSQLSTDEIHPQDSDRHHVPICNRPEVAQGNCMLNRGKSGPNLFEDVLVPAGAESFAADVVFDRSVAL